tara:strand:- start:161 stop:385 length:225 start_codon:yes stop_codon:yes gene_type:complete
LGLDKKIKQLTDTFELRAEIADLIWTTDRMEEMLEEEVANEKFEDAQDTHDVIKKQREIIKAKEKVLKEKEKLL